MEGALVVVTAVAGLAAGAVCNIVIRQFPDRRVPQQKPVVGAGSGGARSRLVEIGCAALFGAAAARFGWSWALPAYLVLFATLLAVSVIDLEHYIVPNRILAPATVAAFPLLGLAALGEGDGAAFAGALVGGVGAFAVLLVVNLISPAGMGMGDVKMSFLLGLHLGFLSLSEVVLGFFVAFLGGALIGLGLVALKLRSRKDAVPFGPFLAAGTVVAVLFGGPLLRWYTGA